jgi:hypothetical protein
MTERDEPNQEQKGPMEPQEPSPELAPPIKGSMNAPTRAAAENRRATQAGSAERRTPLGIRARLSSLWPWPRR